jgi:hypothetical protein
VQCQGRFCKIAAKFETPCRNIPGRAHCYSYETPLAYHVLSAHGISRNADGVLTLKQYAENADACQKRDVLLPIRLFPNIHLNCSQKNRIFSEKGLIFVPNLCTMGHVSRKTFAF